MKYLTIIRHAKSSWENPDLDDIARPLNDRGKGTIKVIGHFLQEKQIQPDLIISSPATRAFETAKGFAEIVKYELRQLKVEPVVYFGASSAIIDMLKTLDNTYSNVFLFGHEPVLSSLIFHFTKKNLEKFPTCAVFQIEFDINNWNGINKGRPVFFISPKQISSEL